MIRDTLIRDGWFIGGDEDDGFGSTMMRMMFLDEEMVHGLVITKTWLPLIINT